MRNKVPIRRKRRELQQQLKDPLLDPFRGRRGCDLDVVLVQGALGHLDGEEVGAKLDGGADGAPARTDGDVVAGAVEGERLERTDEGVLFVGPEAGVDLGGLVRIVEYTELLLSR